jgi:uncharacterized membrane protein
MKLTLPAVLLFFLLSLSYAQGISANYEVIANQDGNVFVLATFSGDGTVLVPLPPDVNAPYVKGALYSKSNGSVLLSLTGDRMATVSYRTNDLARKSNEAWSFSLILPSNLTNVYVSLSLPKSASVSEVNPSNGLIMSEQESLVVAWAASSGLREVRVGYELAKGPDGGGEKPDAKSVFDWTGIVMILGALLLLAIIVGALFYWRSKNAKKSLLVTEGMRNVMKALNENDVRILETVMKSCGEMKRSELERKSEIAKSSLALSLDRLEEKGFVKIDKETTTHRVSLSEWFRSL